MLGRGFSWPSTVPCCMAEYRSEKAITTAEESQQANICRRSSASTVRNLDAGFLGLALVVFFQLAGDDDVAAVAGLAALEIVVHVGLELLQIPEDADLHAQEEVAEFVGLVNVAVYAVDVVTKSAAGQNGAEDLQHNGHAVAIVHTHGSQELGFVGGGGIAVGVYTELAGQGQLLQPVVQHLAPGDLAGGYVEADEALFVGGGDHGEGFLPIATRVVPGGPRRMAQLTVEELQQILVEGLKASREDGKLTKEEITSLGEALLDGTKAKMSAPTVKLLAAAAVDITALIHGAGESWIAKLKAGAVAE